MIKTENFYYLPMAFLSYDQQSQDGKAWAKLEAWQIQVSWQGYYRLHISSHHLDAPGSRLLNHKNKTKETFILIQMQSKVDVHCALNGVNGCQQRCSLNVLSNFPKMIFQWFCDRNNLIYSIFFCDRTFLRRSVKTSNVKNHTYHRGDNRYLWSALMPCINGPTHAIFALSPRAVDNIKRVFFWATKLNLKI